MFTRAVFAQVVQLDEALTANSAAERTEFLVNGALVADEEVGLGKALSTLRAAESPTVIAFTITSSNSFMLVPYMSEKIDALVKFRIAEFTRKRVESVTARGDEIFVVVVPHDMSAQVADVGKLLSAVVAQIRSRVHELVLHDAVHGREPARTEVARVVAFIAVNSGDVSS